MFGLTSRCNYTLILLSGGAQGGMGAQKYVLVPPKTITNVLKLDQI